MKQRNIQEAKFKPDGAGRWRILWKFFINWDRNTGQERWMEHNTEKNHERNLESSRDLRMGWRYTFQQDNDSKQKAMKTLLWCMESVKGPVIIRLKPRLQSNQESLVWFKDCQARAAPSNLNELDTSGHEEWTNIPHGPRSWRMTWRDLILELMQNGDLQMNYSKHF